MAAGARASPGPRGKSSRAPTGLSPSNGSRGSSLTRTTGKKQWATNSHAPQGAAGGVSLGHCLRGELVSSYLRA